MSVFAYEQDNGCVAIIIRLDESTAIESITDKTVIEITSIPESRIFRDAWILDETVLTSEGDGS